MLNHERKASEGVLTDSYSASRIQPTSANLTSLQEDMLEDAVDQVCAPLIGTLPRADRLTRHAALRQELDTLIMAHGELEMTPERAVSEALAHFARLHPVPSASGAIQQVGAQQSVVQQTNMAPTTASARPATLLALSLLVPVYLGHALKWTETLRGPLHFDGPTQDRLELLVLPLLAGLLVGLLIRARATRGMFNACAALAVYTVGIPSLLDALGYLHLLPYEQSSFYNAPFWNWLAIDGAAGYMGLVVWPLLGCMGAFAGANVRNKVKKNLPRMKRMKRIHAD